MNGINYIMNPSSYNLRNVFFCNKTENGLVVPWALMSPERIMGREGPNEKHFPITLNNTFLLRVEENLVGQAAIKAGFRKLWYGGPTHSMGIQEKFSPFPEPPSLPLKIALYFPDRSFHRSFPQWVNLCVRQTFRNHPMLFPCFPQ